MHRAATQAEVSAPARFATARASAFRREALSPSRPSGARPEALGSRYEAEKPHALTLGDGDPVRIGGPLELYLKFRHQYRIVEAEGERGPYKVSTVQYSYSLESDGQEVITYQWHPEGLSSHTDPHLHLGPGAKIGLGQLSDAHIPTGRVSIEDVLLFGRVDPERADLTT